jgi:hypothetical protein
MSADQSEGVDNPSEEAVKSEDQTPGQQTKIVGKLPPVEEFPSERDYWIAKELTFRAYHAGGAVGEELGLDRAATVDDVVKWVKANLDKMGDEYSGGDDRSSGEPASVDGSDTAS